MQQAQETSYRAERAATLLQEENQQQAKLIQELSTRLKTMSTALPAPTETTTADSTASLKATRPGRPSKMNADGSSRAASSERTAADTAGRSTDTDQSALRHQRGRDNPLCAGGPPGPGSYTLISGSGHGIRALSRNLTAELESLEFCSVAHKGQDFKVSRGSNLFFQAII